MQTSTFSSPVCQPAVLCRSTTAGAGEDRAQLVGVDGVGKLFPVEQVGADGVAPGHVAPVDAEWVVLEEQVVLAVVVDQPVGIVGPAASRREMELRAERLVVRALGIRAARRRA